jgi:hypothetical protein
VKSKRGLASCLIIGAVASLMGCLAFILTGYLLVFADNIPWNHYALPVPPTGTTSIVHIEFRDSLDDPSGDTVYVATQDDTLYSNTLFEDKWLPAQKASNWQTDSLSNCAPDWPGAPSNAHIWEPPPVQKQVIDSAGVRFEHPLAIDVRCYVLSEDGLEVWAREDNATAMMAFIEFYGPASAVLGSLIGIVIGIVIVRKIRSKNGAKADPSTPTEAA